MKTSLALGIVIAAAGCADPPLVEAPGANAVACARTADAVLLWDVLARAGVVDGALVKAVGPALVAEAPMIVSALPNGAVVVAARVSPAAAAPLAVGATPVLGGTSAVTIGGQRALVRVDKNRALAALHVNAGDEATVAALLEVMAATKDAPAVKLPPPGNVSLRVAAAAMPFALGDVEALLTPAASGVDVKVTAANPSDGVRAALASANPPFSCAVEKGASIVAAVPPFAPTDAAGAPSTFASPDAFDGRMLLAAYPGGGVVVTGVPKGDPAALLEDKVPAGAKVVVDGTRHSVDLGRVHAVADRGIFLFSFGDAPPIDKAAVCPPSTMLLRMRTNDIPPQILAALPAVAAASLASFSSSVDALTVDGSPDGARGVRIDAHLSLRSMRE